MTAYILSKPYQAVSLARRLSLPKKSKPVRTSGKRRNPLARRTLLQRLRSINNTLVPFFRNVDGIFETFFRQYALCSPPVRANVHKYRIVAPRKKNPFGGIFRCHDFLSRVFPFDEYKYSIFSEKITLFCPYPSVYVRFS